LRRPKTTIAVQAAIEGGRALLSWAIRVEDIEAVAALRGRELMTRSSTNADGSSVSTNQMHEWLGDADLPVRFVSGDPGLHAVGIAGPRGEIVLRDALWCAWTRKRDFG
jgi:hypothetical protein